MRIVIFGYTVSAYFIHKFNKLKSVNVPGINKYTILQKYAMIVDLIYDLLKFAIYLNVYQNSIIFVRVGNLKIKYVFLLKQKDY